MRPENYEDYALLQVFVDTETILYLPEGPIDFSNKNWPPYGDDPRGNGGNGAN